MKVLEYPMRIASKVSFFLVRTYMAVRYMPKAAFIDKAAQTNRVTSPCIIIANHTSILDPLLLLTVIKGKKNIVVAKDWYEKKQFHWILSQEKCIPCDRYNFDTEWIQLAKKNLAEGKSVIIFPEGKTRQDGELNEFKSGFAFLARYTGLPVLSVGIDGIYRFGHRTRYVVGVPEKVERTRGVPSSEDLAQKSELFRQKVKALKEMALEK